MKVGKDRKSSVLPADETSMFCTQIALVLKSGISLADGTEAIYSSCENGPGKKYFEEISTAVTQTGSLYEAVKQVGIFPSYMVEMTGIGERAGKLDDVMEALGLYYEREHNIKKSIKNAVLYPSVLLMMLAIVIAVLVIGVLPIFSNVFESLGIQPDSSAGIMMQAAKITAVIALILITAFLVISGILTLLFRFGRKKEQLTQLFSRFPAIRHINRLIASARFASLMSMMLSSGYNLDEAMQLVPSVLPDNAARQKAVNCRNLMTDGISFPEAILRTGLFSPLYSQMIKVGFHTGQTDTVMQKLAAVYEEEVDDSISKTVSLLEPIMVAVLAIIVGIVLLSVMLPLVSIMSSIG